MTCGHYPKWLNINHPKLVLVNHKDYIPEKYLPTFSSHVIELNLHRIKELSDNFVYFNDDTFLTDYCNKEYFFKNGKPCDIAAINAIVPDHDDMFYQIMNNNWAVLNGYFNKNEVIKKDFFKWINLKYGTDLLGTLLLQPWSNFVGFRVSHMPTSLQKPTFEKLWELEKEKLDTTCLHKFRNITDLNQYVIEFYQVVSGNFFLERRKQLNIITLILCHQILNK